MYRDTEKFLELLKPHYSNALNYCIGLCYKRSADEGKDLFQDALLKALENINSLKDDAKFRSWFFTIITREFYNSSRKYFWKRFTSTDDPKIFEIPLKNKTENEDKLTLLNALTTLRKKERMELLLFELGGFSIDEISKIAGESLSAVKSRLSRARAKLRERITEMEENKTSREKNNSNQIGDLENETFEIIAGLRTDK
ncbi:MAG TPA: RNA polymerase sigma factor [Ignavibacteria bacterium]|nr:RNA polymerase sigma factor [Ignavibacteria bacterium]